MSDYYKNRREIEFKVGILFVVALVVLVAGVAFLKDIAYSGERKTFRVKFASTNGLDPGDKVKINGIAVGKIDKLSLQKDGVLVEATIEKQDFELKNDSQFIASESSLMGGHHLEIIPGNSGIVLDFSIVHQGESGNSIFSIINEAKGLVTDLSTSIAYLNSNLDIIDSTKTLIYNTSETMNSIREVLETNDDNIEQLIKNLKQSSDNVAKIILDNQSNIDSTLQQTPIVLANLNSNLSELKTVVSKVNNIIYKYETSDNTIKRLIEEKDLYDDIRKTLISADSLISDVKQHPKKYINVKIF